MRGFALPVVLFLLALGGALAAGGSFVARQQAATTRTISRSTDVDALAEEWLGRTIAGWDSSSAGQVGVTAALAELEVGGARISRWITRTDSFVYWVSVDVSSGVKPLLRRRLGASLLRSGNGLLLTPGWGWMDLP